MKCTAGLWRIQRSVRKPRTTIENGKFVYLVAEVGQPVGHLTNLHPIVPLLALQNNLSLVVPSRPLSTTSHRRRSQDSAADAALQT